MTNTPIERCMCTFLFRFSVSGTMMAVAIAASAQWNQLGMDLAGGRRGPLGVRAPQSGFDRGHRAVRCPPAAHRPARRARPDRAGVAPRRPCTSTGGRLIEAGRLHPARPVPSRTRLHVAPGRGGLRALDPCGIHTLRDTLPTSRPCPTPSPLPSRRFC